MPVVRHRLATLVVALLGALLLPLAIAGRDAHAAPKKLRLVFTRCSSVPHPCLGSHRVVVRTGRMLVGAGGMTRRARVEFRIRNRAGKVGRRRVGGTFRTPTRLLVRVPGNAITGRVRVVQPGPRGPRRSNAVRIVVRNPPKPKVGVPADRDSDPTVSPTVFDGAGMWVWYLNRAEGGDIARIAAKAKAANVRTVYVKSADGTNVWSQFSSGTVAALRAAGLRVCGWQFVYGNDPIGEARAGAAAKTAGADCFVIDAEGAYEGKYAQAQRYVTALRAAVGPEFPLALTSFPYVHYHPGLPYSVFLGPGGATANLPQVYWKDIGTTVATSMRITYQHNVVYKRPIHPIGQAYGNTSAADVRQFRELASAYGSRGESWWVWDYASASNWAAIGEPIVAPVAVDPAGYPTLKANGTRVGSRGDLVVWAQQHLAGAGHPVEIDGHYGPATARAVRDYQAAKGLPQTGVIDAETWPTLLREEPAIPDWTRARAARAAAARTGGATTGPRSAALPAKRNELAPRR